MLDLVKLLLLKVILKSIPPVDSKSMLDSVFTCQHLPSGYFLPTSVNLSKLSFLPLIVIVAKMSPRRCQEYAWKVLFYL